MYTFHFLLPISEQDDENEDEESAEELFSASVATRAKSPNPIVIKNKANDNDFESVSTDFTSILDVASNKWSHTSWYWYQQVLLNLSHNFMEYYEYIPI